LGGEVVLVGRLVWDDRDLGWARSRWTAPRTVGKSAASFDETFDAVLAARRNLVRQWRSGHPIVVGGGNRLH
jgi:hypothetical protein